MKLGILSNVIGDTPLKEALAYFKSLGAQMVEIGCGGYPGKDHCNPEVLLHDEAKFNEFVTTIKESGLEISALSCHANPVHPNKEIAKQFDDDLHNAVLMAEKLLRLPRRLPREQEPQLGGLRLAQRVPRGAGVAVERSAYPLLEGLCGLCQRAWGGQNRF